MYRIPLLGGVLWLSLTACEQAAGPREDLEPPTIAIIAPQPGQVLAKDQSLPIAIELSENQELHEYSVVVRSDDDSLAETVALGHEHGTYLLLEDSLLLPWQAGMTYRLTVKANDHNDNLASESVAFSVQ